MKQDLLIFGGTVVIVVVVFGVALVTYQPPSEKATPVTVRTLLADPEFYTNRPVTFPSDGFQREGETLVYRKVADQPPVIVCYFEAPPDNAATTVVGVCTGQHDGVVVITNCKSLRR